MDKQELKKFGFSSLHTHSDIDSNLRFYDAVETVPDILDFAEKNHYNAVSLTGHESLSSHIKGERIYHEKPRDFKLVLGNEIYLVDEQKMKQTEENNDKFRFNHFLLNALDRKGHEFLQKQSTLAWKHRHMYHGSERVPTYFTDLENLMKDYKGHVVGSSACLAGTFAQNVLKYDETKDKQYLDNAIDFLNWGIKVFGQDNFFIELMPSHHTEQLIVNEYGKKLSKQLGIGFIITTDAHYVDERQRLAHTTLLRSRDPERDVTAYDTAHLFTVEGLFEFFNTDVLTEAFENLQSIVDRVQDYSFAGKPLLPDIQTTDISQLKDIDKVDNKYSNIWNFYNSETLSNKVFLSEVFKGMNKYHVPYNDEYLSRIDLEIGELIKISNKINQPMSNYFLVEKDLLDIAWEVSLVGPGRGSSSCWITNFLLGLTKIDAIKYNLPYYRFLSAERVAENKADQYPDEQLQRLA